MDKYFTWVVCYIDSTKLDTVARDLAANPEYKEIEVFIPTVRILKKTFRGKNEFEEVPLLFNYGFFKVPRKYAVYYSFLNNMKDNISCIFSWLRDPVKSKLPLPLDTNQYLDGHVHVATCTPDEITKMVDASYWTSLHTPEEVNSLRPGQIITLRGYPFDNIMAEIIEVYLKKRKVKVKLEILNEERPVVVSFDNVFFTIYHNRNFDDSISIKDSLDDFQEKNTLDKKLFKHGNQ